MSRFRGWTAAAVERLTGEKVLSKPTKNIPKNIPDYAGELQAALKALGIESVREYKFLHDRRFRFDLAIPQAMIAIELEGGIFSRGRHTRGKGYANDAKKYNLAVRHGWKLFRYTTADFKDSLWAYVVAEEIKAFLNSIGNPKKN